MNWRALWWQGLKMIGGLLALAAIVFGIWLVFVDTIFVSIVGVLVVIAGLILFNNLIQEDNRRLLVDIKLQLERSNKINMEIARRAAADGKREQSLLSRDRN